ncbi:MAG: hypothetical protein IT337_11065 [Thermomicrobiales bacterium]|nr:hypothetical protein [Thermomicrobiales bacterium]
MDRRPAEYAGELLGMATLLRRACDSADERGAVECIVDVVLMADLLAVRMGHSLTVAIPERFDAVSRRIGSKVFLGAGGAT